MSFLAQEITRPAYSHAIDPGTLLCTDTINEATSEHVDLNSPVEASITTAVAPLRTSQEFVRRPNTRRLVEKVCVRRFRAHI